MCYNVSMNEFYTVSQFAKKIGKHIKTLQVWDRKGIFKARRTPTNRRYYTHEDYERYMGGEWNQQEGRD
jgi:putative resolvase